MRMNKRSSLRDPRPLLGRIALIGCLAAVALCASGNATPGAAFGGTAGGFIENRGQVSDEVLYYASGAEVDVFLTRDAVVLDLIEEAWEGITSRDPRERWGALRGGDGSAGERSRRACGVWLRFAGASAVPTVEARGRLDTRYNYLLGNDPAGWRSDVPAYAEIVYRDLWAGIDLVFRHVPGGFAYEIVAHPGADPEQVRFAYEGLERIVSQGEGSLRIETAIGVSLEQRTLRTGEGALWGIVATEIDEDALELIAGDRDDPARLLWSTFVGTSAPEEGFAVGLDFDWNPVVTGLTFSSGFPVTPGAHDVSFNGVADVFVSKLDASGSALIWSTFLGGEDFEVGLALDMDADDDIVLTGETMSVGFPVTGAAYDGTYNGGVDVFVSKLDASGSSLIWSTFLGSAADEGGYGVGIDYWDGFVMVTGSTTSPGFPTTQGAFDRVYNGPGDAFVSTLDPAGSFLVGSTFLGGANFDAAWGLGHYGNEGWVTGWTDSPDFPTTEGAYDETWNGDSDAFVARVDGSCTDLPWCTFLGGSGSDQGYAAAAYWDLGVDLVVVTGLTCSADFPVTPGAHDGSLGGVSDAFVALLDVFTGSSLLGCTYLGGSDSDMGWGIAATAAGEPVVTGGTTSLDFPTTGNAYDQSHNGELDAFVCRLDASASTLQWSSYLGGSASDEGHGLAVDPWLESVVVTGTTGSSDFPTTTGAYGPSYNGVSDVFVSCLDMIVATTLHVPSQYSTIQAAINAARPGDTVLVADGTYTGDGNRNIDFLGKAITVRSENGNPETCIIDCENSARGFYFHSGEGSGSVLEGMTITNGADSYGGILCASSSPTLTNCILSGNSVYGMFCDLSSSPTITNCTFSGSANDGMFCRQGSSPTVTNCIFSGNGFNGIFMRSGASPTVTYCTFAGNARSGMFFRESGTPTVSNCTFVGNSTSGIYCDQSASPTLENSIIAFGTDGEAVHCDATSSATLICSDVYGNAGGDWVGCIAGQDGISGNICLDPLFCGPEEGDFTLAENSPCAPFSPPNEECDLIGAWPVGCSPAPEPVIDITVDLTPYFDWGAISSYPGLIPPGNMGIASPAHGYQGCYFPSDSLAPFTFYPKAWLTPGIHFATKYGPANVRLSDCPVPDAMITVPDRDGAPHLLRVEIPLASLIDEATDENVIRISAGETTPPIAISDTVETMVFLASCDGYAESLDYPSPSQPLEVRLNYQDGSADSVVFEDIHPAGRLDIVDPIFPPSWIFLYGNEVFVCDPGYFDDQDLDPYHSEAWHWYVLYPDNRELLSSVTFEGIQTGEHSEVYISALSYRKPQSSHVDWDADAPQGATRLMRSAPNPFARSTVIRFELARPSEVDLSVYDVSGRRLQVLVAGSRAAGQHVLTWDGRDGRAGTLGSGIYFLRFAAGEVRQNRRLVLLR